MAGRASTYPKQRRSVASAAPPLSDDALADAFAEQHQGYLSYRADLATWMVWTGTHWRRDEKATALNAIRRLCREASRDADENKRVRLASLRKISDVERLARSDPRLMEPASRWDSDDWLLNTQAGIVDLRSG